MKGKRKAKGKTVWNWRGKLRECKIGMKKGYGSKQDQILREAWRVGDVVKGSRTGYHPGIIARKCAMLK